MRKYYILKKDNKYFISSKRWILNTKQINVMTLIKNGIFFNSLWLKQLVGGWVNRLIKENSAFKLYVFKKDYDLSRIAPKEFILDLDFKPGGCENFNSIHTKYTDRVNKPEVKRSSIDTECDNSNKIDLTKLSVNEQLDYMKSCIES
jgi:hypothetical protein